MSFKASRPLATWWLLALAAALCALAISACGSDDSGDTTTTIQQDQADGDTTVIEGDTTSQVETVEGEQAAVDAGATTDEDADPATDDATADAGTVTTTETVGPDGITTTVVEEPVDPDAETSADATTDDSVVDSTPAETTTDISDLDNSLPPSDVQLFDRQGTALAGPSSRGNDPLLRGSDGETILERPFSSDSPWNTPIADAAVDRRSDELIRKAQKRVGQEEVLAEDTLTNVTADNDRSTSVEFRDLSGEGVVINNEKWTVPVFSNSQPNAVNRVAICRQSDCGEDAVTSVTIPLDACPDPRYDGWMTVLDANQQIALDFWRGRCEADGSLSYHFVKKWDLGGPGFQQPTGVSARGSGLPLFAGLITPEEIRDGRIDHALAMSVPGAAQRRYVQPASRTDGTGLVTSLPEGARIRLKADVARQVARTLVRRNADALGVDTRSLAEIREEQRELRRNRNLTDEERARLREERRNAPLDTNGSDLRKTNTVRGAARTIVTALQEYGAIIVDRSAAPTMYAQRNANWEGILPLNIIQDIRLSAFEVLQLGPIFQDPPPAGEDSDAIAERLQAAQVASGDTGSDSAEAAESTTDDTASEDETSDSDNSGEFGSPDSGNLIP